MRRFRVLGEGFLQDPSIIRLGVQTSRCQLFSSERLELGLDQRPPVQTLGTGVLELAERRCQEPNRNLPVVGILADVVDDLLAIVRRQITKALCRNATHQLQDFLVRRRNSKMSQRDSTALKASFFLGMTLAAKMNRLVVSNRGGNSLGNWELPYVTTLGVPHSADRSRPKWAIEPKMRVHVVKEDHCPPCTGTASSTRPAA